ncbi:MAG TPA: dethiobiotin synthase [Verrucomicrobiae bacterium]
MRRSATRLLFITGTDTGVGKTLLTGLLLAHSRQSGFRSLALKPFCSGDRSDARLLHQLQDRDLALDDINPFHFAQPLAPLAAARKHPSGIRPSDVLRHIRFVRETLASRSAALPAPRSATHVPHALPPPTLLLEGIGGLLVPLAERFNVLDLIVRLRCEVLVVALNRLGTINHTLLTLQALRNARVRCTSIVLMNTRFPDASCASNPGLLKKLIVPVPLLQLPFLRPAPTTPKQIRAHAACLAPALHKLLS